MLQALTNFLILIAWAALWSVGGIWLARGAFRLNRREEALTGVALGFIVQNWLVNWLVRFVPLPWVSWLGAVLVLLAGFLLAWRSGRINLQAGRAIFDRRLAFIARPVRIPDQLALWAGFAAILFIAYQVSRGMAIFDDYAHLPILSTMAAGDIPPHFSFDPNVVYGYHHFLLLFSAQAMRVGELAPWTGYDVGRALSFALAVILAALWTARLTRSRVAGVLGGLMMAFGSGTRWLLLFLPHRVVQWLSKDVTLIGSGAGSGPNLAEAVTHAWAVEGGGPLAFPFAFANGILPPGVITIHSSNGSTMFVVILLLLLTFSRWRAGSAAKRTAGILSAIVFSTWGLLTEAELVLLLVGWGVVALAVIVQRRSLRLPASLWQWLAVVVAGAMLGFLSGGAWTDLIVKTVERLVTGVASPSYQTVGFTLAAPAVVSSHLGVLPLLNSSTLGTALFELGPLLLVIPLLAGFGLRAYRQRRWYEAANAAAAVLALAMVFVQFTGSTGVRNTPRLYVFMPLCVVFAVPLAWWWAARRTEITRAVIAVLGLTAVAGGMVMAGIELLAAQRPVYSYFITPLDARMTAKYWNQLPADALVFDPEPSRATTVFGRFTDSGYTWFAAKPQWEALRAAPDPTALQSAGFDYLYFDTVYWDEIGPDFQERLQASCVITVDEATGEPWGFRRLLDLRGCR